MDAAEGAEDGVHEGVGILAVAEELDSHLSVGVVEGEREGGAVGDGGKDGDSIAGGGNAVVGDGTPNAFEHSCCRSR